MELVRDEQRSSRLLLRRRLLLLVASIIAGAGIAYELSLILLGTVTVGSAERTNAIVIGIAMFGMGLGATFGRALSRSPVRNFVLVEVMLAIVGASAAPGLYWTWARLDSLWGPLLIVALVLGLCIGAEMPLLAGINDTLARQAAPTVVSALTAADYFGALVGALAFGFLVRPSAGLVSGTILIAALNLAAAAAVPFIAGHGRRPATAAVAAGAVVLVALARWAPAIVDDGRQAQFRDPIVATAESGVQQLVVTSRRHPGVVDTRLFLNGDLQLSTVDEHRYHESLVHPAVGALGRAPTRALILGGGDCLAARELLRYPTLSAITLVELDPAVTAMMRRVPELKAATAGACDDPRLRIVNDDAFVWAKTRSGLSATSSGDQSFDVIVVDFPDPDTLALGRLYSVELYAVLEHLVAPGGAVVVQCGSTFFSPKAYWTCATTLEAAGWAVLPYHVDVPSFGDWGFHLVRRPADSRNPIQLGEVDGSRFLDEHVFRAATVFPLDVRRSRFDTEVSTVLNPTIVEAAQGRWIGY